MNCIHIVLACQPCRRSDERVGDRANVPLRDQTSAVARRSICSCKEIAPKIFKAVLLLGLTAGILLFAASSLPVWVIVAFTVVAFAIGFCFRLPTRCCKNEEALHERQHGRVEPHDNKRQQERVSKGIRSTLEIRDGGEEARVNALDEAADRINEAYLKEPVKIFINEPKQADPLTRQFRKDVLNFCQKYNNYTTEEIMAYLIKHQIASNKISIKTQFLDDLTGLIILCKNGETQATLEDDLP